MLQNLSCFKDHFLWEKWAGKQRNFIRFPAGARATGGCSSGVNWPELEPGHSFASCAEVKNEKSGAYTPTVCCHGVHRGKLKFYLEYYWASWNKEWARTLLMLQLRNSKSRMFFDTYLYILTLNTLWFSVVADIHYKPARWTLEECYNSCHGSFFPHRLPVFTRNVENL